MICMVLRFIAHSVCSRHLCCVPDDVHFSQFFPDWPSRGLTDLPTFLLFCGFHFKGCLVVSVAGFYSVSPIHVHLRLLAFSVGICRFPVLFQGSLLLILSGQWILRIFLRHRLTRSEFVQFAGSIAWITLPDLWTTLHRSIAFTFVVQMAWFWWKSMSETDEAFQTGLN